MTAVFRLGVHTLLLLGDNRGTEWRMKPQHITTPRALMETCRLLGDRSTHGLGLPWEPVHMASWTHTDVFAVAPVWTLSDRYVSMAKRERLGERKPVLPASFNASVKLKVLLLSPRSHKRKKKDTGVFTSVLKRVKLNIQIMLIRQRNENCLHLSKAVYVM